METTPNCGNGFNIDGVRDVNINCAYLCFGEVNVVTFMQTWSLWRPYVRYGLAWAPLAALALVLSIFQPKGCWD